MSKTQTSVRRPAPRLGEHTAEMLSLLETDAPRPAPSVGENQARLPLEGLRILDIATVIAVPYMGALLSDLGAEVIKIESPKKLDPTRQGVLTTYLDNDSSEDGINRSGMFNVVNRGKRSIVLDMKTEEARGVFRELVAKADILIDNFTPRVLTNWGLSPEALLEINPRLICLSNTGYGSTGPWKNFPSQGTTLESTMGIAAYTGYRDDKPWKVGQSYPDFTACWVGLTALFAALRHVRRTGEGQWVDLGMYQVGVAMIPEALLQYQRDGSQPERIGNEDAQHVPSDAYPCAGEDRWVAISVTSDGQWQALAAHMTRDGLTVDPRLATQSARQARRSEVNALVADWVRTRDAFDLMERLQADGIACGPIMDNRDVLLDPHLRHRGFHERVDMPAPIGNRPIMGRPWNLANRKVHIRKPAPRYGDDGRAILRDVLGMSEDRIETLFEIKAVCSQPTSPRPFDAMGLAELQRVKAIHAVDPGYRAKLGIGS